MFFHKLAVHLWKSGETPHIYLYQICKLNIMYHVINIYIYIYLHILNLLEIKQLNVLMDFFNEFNTLYSVTLQVLLIFDDTFNKQNTLLTLWLLKTIWSFMYTRFIYDNKSRT